MGAAVGLAVLVLVANAGTQGLSSEPLRIAVSEGIARVAYAIACGVMLMLVIRRALVPHDQCVPERSFEPLLKSGRQP
jgi:hypothetical protein